MYATDLEIYEDSGDYSLTFDGRVIECLFTNDPVSSNMKEVIEHIKEDFDRCGNLEIIDNKIQTNGVNCAYHIFSIQKYKVEDKETFQEILSGYSICTKYDFALIQTANGPPLETEQRARFMPMRNALEEQIGKENFKEITEYAWGAYYSKLGYSVDDGEDYDGPGKLVTDEDFQKTDASKAIFDVIKNTSEEDAACICALHESLNYQSLLLPLALMKGWITKSEYVSGSMVLGGQIADLSGVEGTDESHQESFSFYNNIAEICLNFSEASKNPLLVEESIFHEYKASLRTPYPDYPPEEKSKGQTEFRLGKEVFTSKKQINKFLEQIILKTVASFLNTRGGKLVIGVHEQDNKKTIVGIGREGFKSNDLYERHLIGLMNNAFGADLISQNVTTEIAKYKNKDLCVVTIKNIKGPELAYLNDKVFVRTGPRVDELSTKEVVNWVKKMTRGQN